MSFQDETAEPNRPGPDAHRVLSPADLVDLKYAADRARMALAELPGAINEGNDGAAYGIVGRLSTDVHAIIRNLGLDDIDDDDDDPQAMNVGKVERITRNGGRTDG